MPAHVPRPMNVSAPFSSWTAACHTGSRSLTSPSPGCATACPTSSTGSSAASRATAPRWHASMRHCRGPGRQPRLAANHRVTDRHLASPSPSQSEPAAPRRGFACAPRHASYPFRQPVSAVASQQRQILLAVKHGDANLNEIMGLDLTLRWLRRFPGRPCSGSPPHCLTPNSSLSLDPRIDPYQGQRCPGTPGMPL